MPTPEPIPNDDTPTLVPDVDGPAQATPTAVNSEASQTPSTPSTITPVAVPPIDKVS